MLRKIDLAYLPKQPQISPANKNMLCGVQITLHGGVKQRAATASHTSLGGDTHLSVVSLLQSTLTVGTM